GQTAQNGVCTCTSNGFPPCNGVCCSPGQSCFNGTCTNSCCQSGQSFCNGQCVDTQTSSANCGSCGHACAQGQTCSGGTCSGGCVPTSTCPQGQNCGTAPDGCGGTLNCGSCGQGLTCCSGVCTDLRSDPDHCGQCNSECEAPDVQCYQGVCCHPRTSCPPGV